MRHAHLENAIFLIGLFSLLIFGVTGACKHARNHSQSDLIEEVNANR